MIKKILRKLKKCRDSYTIGLTYEQLSPPTREQVAKEIRAYFQLMEFASVFERECGELVKVENLGVNKPHELKFALIGDDGQTKKYIVIKEVEDQFYLSYRNNQGIFEAAPKVVGDLIGRAFETTRRFVKEG